MKHIIFDAYPRYKTALLIKTASFDKTNMLTQYVKPLNALLGHDAHEFIGFNLKYNEHGKCPVKFIKAYLDKLLKSLDSLGVTTLYVADSNYFKTLVNERKAEPHYGYVLPCAIEGYTHMQVVLGTNYSALFYNPALQSKLDLSLKTLVNHIQGTYTAIGDSIIHSATYPESLTEIAQTFEQLHQYDELTCDLETFSLRFYEAGIGTIAFAWDEHNGTAFACDYVPHPFITEKGIQGYQRPNRAVRKLFKEFLINYQGKLIWHNAGFDVKVVIYTLWMEDLLDTAGLLEGIEAMTRHFEDTKLIAYLAVNSCTGNKLSLKDLAHEFAGNWAQSDIKDICRIPLSELLQYNLVDCLATQYVYKKYYPIMIRDQQEDVYKTIFKPSVKILLQIELTGMPLDMKQVRATEQELQTISDGFQQTMQHSPVVKRFLKQHRYDLMMMDFAARKEKAKHPDKVKIKPISAFEGEQFNPNSNSQLQKLFYKVLDYPVIDKTDTKQPATGGKTLKKLLVRAKCAEDAALLEALIGFFEVDKILGTFIKAFKEKSFLAPDGIYYLFGSFNLGGTVSGRLSSCVAPWTRVKTLRGLIPITEIKIGDSVWTHQRRWKPVLDVIEKPQSEMVDIQFCTGHILSCTTAHKLNVPNRGWTTVQEIINERIENVDAEYYEYTECTRAISGTRGNQNCTRDCRQSTQQQPGQSCALHANRPQNNSQSTSDISVGKIKAIYHRSITPVWDITVADDHSYWAEGCFNHNSGPNLQNLPSSGSKYAKHIKRCFAAPPGWLLVGADFSSLEDRIAALITKDPNKLRVYEDLYDGHCLRAFAYFGDQMPDIVAQWETIEKADKVVEVTFQDGTIDYLSIDDERLQCPDLQKQLLKAI